MRESQLDLEIQDGLAEWEARPTSRLGRHPERANDFWVDRSPEPLDYLLLTEHCRTYCEANLERLLPVLLPGDKELPFNEALEELWLHPGAVRDLGLGYFVREAKLTGEPRLFLQTRAHPHGRLAVEDGVRLDESKVGVVDLLALEFLSRNLRRDESGDDVRYFFLPENRYLCTNDEHMSGDLADLRTFFAATRQYFEAVRDNLGVYAGAIAKLSAESEAGRWERPKLMERVRRELTTDSEGADLAFAPVSMRQLYERAKHYDGNLAQNIALSTDFSNLEPSQAFFAFDAMTEFSSQYWLQDVLCRDESARRAGLQVAKSEVFGVRLPYNSLLDLSVLETGQKLHDSLKSYMAQEAAKERPETAAAFKRLAPTDRPELYPALYLMLVHFGDERVERLLADGRATGLIDGFELIWKTGYDIRDLPEREIREHLWNAHLAMEYGIMRYLSLEDSELQELRRSSETDFSERRERIQNRRAELYDRAETILGRVRVWAAARPDLTFEGALDRLRNRWELLDYDLPGQSDEEIIPVLVWRTEEVYWLLVEYGRLAGPGGECPAENRATNSELIVSLADAAKAGFDPALTVMFPDVEKYLQQLVDGEIAADQAGRSSYILSERWPEHLCRQLDYRENELAVQHAGALLSEFGAFPVGALAAWRAQRDPEWSELLENPAWNYEVLRFELALTQDYNEPHQAQVKEALERVGFVTVQHLYETARQWNIVDAMNAASLWTQFDTGLPQAELRGILKSVQNLPQLRQCIDCLARYRLEDDSFAERLGPPQSLRALESRLSARPEDVEYLFDRSDLPSRWEPYMEAPGFDFGKLAQLEQHPEFERLRNGELDRTQPFRPRSEYSLERPLHHSLYEALGSLRQGVSGTAQDPKKLFHKLKHFLKDRGSELTVKDLAQQEVPPELESSIIGIVAEHERYHGELVERLTAELHAKSDPRGWVSGNYTDCCIPFGRSLTNDYLVSPATQIFTVSRGERVIAQSVVVDAIDRRTGRRAIVLDSVEIANNYRSEREAIERAYRQFWRRAYPRRQLLVGKVFDEDSNLGATEVVKSARFRPAAPLDYSDAWRFGMYRVGQATDQPDGVGQSVAIRLEGMARRLAER